MRDQATRGHILVVSLMPQDTTTTLFFGSLAGRSPVRIVEYPGDIARPLSGASAVIIVRGLFECRDAIWCTRRLGIPRYYFLDDNFMLIRDESSTYGRFYDRYTDDAVRTMLQDFSGVLLATDALIDYFREHRLHDRLLLFPPTAAPLPAAEPAPADDRPLTVAFFGGLHRREPVVRFVFPAVCRLARSVPVRLVAVGLETADFPSAVGVEMVCPRYEPSYRVGMQRLAEHGVDILVHPSSPTENNPYKNRHVLINANSLGAAAIFSDTPPYDALAQTGVAVVCENTEAGWLEALKQVAFNAELRRDLRRRLADYCTRHFSGDSNIRIIEDLLKAHPSPSARTQRARWAAGMPCLALARGLRVVGRQLKPA